MAKREKSVECCVDQLRKTRALKVIEDCGGSLTIAAERLGVSIATLSRWRASARKPLWSSERVGQGLAECCVVLANKIAE